MGGQNKSSPSVLVPPYNPPQQDNYIEQIHRLEGLMAYAEQQKDWDELERLKERLKKLLEQMA